MALNDSPVSGPGNYFRYAAIGLEFFSPIVAGVLGGYYLGEYIHMPWLGLVGLLAGVAVGFYRLIVEVRCATRSSRRSTNNFSSRDTSS